MSDKKTTKPSQEPTASRNDVISLAEWREQKRPRPIVFDGFRPARLDDMTELQRLAESIKRIKELVAELRAIKNIPDGKEQT